MLGLGEKEEELFQVMDDLRCAQVDFLTLGQYLQPTEKHYPIQKFVPPDAFNKFEKIALCNRSFSLKDIQIFLLVIGKVYFKRSQAVDRQAQYFCFHL